MENQYIKHDNFSSKYISPLLTAENESNVTFLLEIMHKRKKEIKNVKLHISPGENNMGENSLCKNVQEVQMSCQQYEGGLNFKACTALPEKAEVCSYYFEIESVEQGRCYYGKAEDTEDLKQGQGVVFADNPRPFKIYIYSFDKLFPGWFQHKESYFIKGFLQDIFFEKRTADFLYRRLVSSGKKYPQPLLLSKMNTLTIEEIEKFYGSFEDIIAGFENMQEQEWLKKFIYFWVAWPGIPVLENYDEHNNGEDVKKRHTDNLPVDDLLNLKKEADLLRDFYSIFRTGFFEPIIVNENIIGLERYYKDGRDVLQQKREDNRALIFYNSSREEKADIKIAFLRDKLNLDQKKGVYDILEDCFVDQKKGKVRLNPGEVKIFLQKRWSKRLREERAAGVLLHITSLPSNYGIGDLGKGAYRFVDFLKEAGQKYWQILPFNPPGTGFSPYQCFSSFAGNSMLISPGKLYQAGYLKKEELPRSFNSSGNKVDFVKVKKIKRKLFKKAFKRFLEGKVPDDFTKFKKENDFWLQDYCLFRALKERYQDKPWNKWPKAAAFRNEKVIRDLKAALGRTIKYYQFVQYIFFKQWQALYNYASRKGIKIIGDIPIFTAHDSSDVWANPGLFKLDGEGRPNVVAGVPPDDFSEDGQRWGNPIYNWEQMKKNNFKWWCKRFEYMEKMVDVVRIDHFRGFESYWEIPAREKTAVKGEWVSAPGEELLDKITEEFNELEIIAEDLGLITPEVKKLKKRYDFPGMKVLHFITEPGRDNLFSLDHYNNVVYTGTHDNKTTWQWYSDYCQEREQKINGEKQEICWGLIEEVLRSPAKTAIIPLQDYLCLGAEGRMNKPGTTDDNWNWCLSKNQFSSLPVEKIRKLTEKYYRI